ncbi:MAG: type I restriction enzyme HsdR N-terminal domain-containing protein [Lentimicrobiaceae bacterium]|nr:type I restriction enzyme HsdR N-terminal domain-containing protein [Lentimicrobiaceae bacterium]
MNPSKQQLFGDIDFQTIEQDANFKEDSVREVIILPILKQLGYEEQNIVRSKTLKHPFLTIGSNKKREIKLVPDYLLKIGENYAWVLDAKSPKQRVDDSNHIEQVYSYATHPEIRCTYFALCNGLEFVLYRREDTNTPLLYFPLEEIENHWENLEMYLSPNSSYFGSPRVYDAPKIDFRYLNFDYLGQSLPIEIPVKKRAAKRHFGVHGYFTKQSWNVVAEYIKNFSKPGDLILDPFGGSGVTAIEALMNSRRGINIDLNPMAVFMVQALVAPVNQNELAEAFERIKKEYIENEPKTKDEIKKAIKKYPQPKPLSLPQDSDVETVVQLFSDKQLAQLGYLKYLILKQKNKNIRDSLLLMFSGLVSRVNLTYHTGRSAKGDSVAGANAAAFQYYRYRMAPKPTEIDTMKFFELRYKRVLAAKKEMSYFINDRTIGNIDVRKDTATNLSFLPKESVDYIYTDPPYGKKIPYLDLSAMWNAWLDLDITEGVDFYFAN